MARKKDAETVEEGQAEVEVKPTIEKKEQWALKCELTDEELLSFGSKMADAQQELAECDAELKSFKEQIGGRKAVAEAAAGQYGAYVRQKYQHRNVECRIELNYETETMTVTRLDTGAVIDSRAMNRDELERLPM